MAHAQFIMRYFRRVECRFKQLKALGIMRDAERDSEAAVASLQTTLRHAGFAAPDAPNHIRTTPVPAVAYLVIPHDEPSGYLAPPMVFRLNGKSLLILTPPTPPQLPRS